MGADQRDWTSLFGRSDHSDLEDWQIVIRDSKTDGNKANCKIKITTTPFEYAGETMPAAHHWPIWPNN